MEFSNDQERRKIPSKYRKDEKRHEENERFEKLLHRLEDMTTKGHMRDLAYYFRNKREVIKVNLIAGISRGVGLTIGTALFIGLFIFILNQFLSLPLIGEYIAGLLDMIEIYRQE